MLPRDKRDLKSISQTIFKNNEDVMNNLKGYLIRYAGISTQQVDIESTISLEDSGKFLLV